MATPRASITPAAESALWPLVLASLPERGPAYDVGVPSEWIWRLVQRPAESGDWALQRMVDAGLLVRIDGAGGPWWRKVIGAVVPAPVDQFGGLANGAVLRVIDGSRNVEGQMPVTTSAGAADAGKLPQLDAAGKLDPSLVDGTFATDAEVAAAVAAHEAAGDPHPGYATDGDVSTVAGNLASHVAASNPHTGAQPIDALLTAISALTTAADQLAYFTGVDTVALTTFTAAARTFAAAADAAAQRAALGLTPAGGLEQSGSNVQIADNGVTNAKLRDSAALSVFGRSANSTGDPADIAAASDGHVLRRSGTTLGFGTVATAGITANAATNTIIRDSAALSVIGRSANSTGDPADIAASVDGQVLRRSGTALGFGTVATAGITDAAVTDAKLRNSVALSIIGRSANSTGVPADIATTADGDVLRRSGTTLGFGTIVPSAIGTVTTARILGRTTAGTGLAEQLTVGSNLTLGSGELRFAHWKPQTIMLNPTGSTAAPVTIDVADAAGMVDAFIGSTWAFPCIKLADGSWVFVVL